MKSWLKFTFIGYFKNSITREAESRSLFNVLSGILLSFVFLMCGLWAGYTAAFGVHYNNASSFRAFINKNADEVNVTGGKLLFDGESPTDFSESGFRLIIDTRPSSTTYDDVKVFCTKKDDGTTISYEEYLALTKQAQGDYTVGVERTGQTLVFTEQRIDEYMTFLEGDDSHSAEYAALIADRANMSVYDFNNALYELYFKAYYPQSLAQLDSFGGAPTIKSYYLSYFYRDNTDEVSYLILVDDMMMCNFVTDGGIWQTFVGYYDNIRDGKVGIDELISGGFKSTAAINAYMYFINTLRAVGIVLLVLFVFALIVIPIAKKTDIGCADTLMGAVKTVASFQIWSALFGGVCAFILSFITGRTQTLLFTVTLYPLIILARLIIFLAIEAVRTKNTEKCQNNGQNDIFKE